VNDTAAAPIAVALDAPDRETLVRWARAVAPVVSTLKIGLEVYLREGPDVVETVRRAAEAEGCAPQVFLDLKLHDIPATVAGAARSVAALQPAFLTVHASGGPEMIFAAAQQLPATRITAVTVLTSLGHDDLDRLGFLSGGEQPVDVVRRWSLLAVEAGARALVCSPQEVAVVRQVVPPDIVLITPGVRPAGSDPGDQRRTATPAQALADGADLLVIGRPITGAEDPRAAAGSIAQMITATDAAERFT
jgi:orotidine-5'-phosphate decarboxylase